MPDLRLAIGGLFVLIGTLLVGYGLASPVLTAVGRAQVNLNVCWGSLMGLFGLCMLLLALKKNGGG